MNELQTENTETTEEIKRKRSDAVRRWRLQNPERASESARKYREANREKINQKARQHRDINREIERERVRVAVAKFRKTKPGRYYEIQRKYDLANPEKRLIKSKRYQVKFPLKLKAQSLVNQAIRRGELIRQSCVCCGKENAEAHHSDYTKPLDVQWLCKKHHVAWHKLFIPEGGE